MSKVGFSLLGRQGWQAGFVYTTNLLRSLRMLKPDGMAFSLVLSGEDVYLPEEFRNLFHEIIFYPFYHRWTPTWCIDGAFKRLFRRDLIRDLFLARQQINVLALSEPPRGCNIPTLAWLPDFQHVHIPEMFSLRERKNRNDSFMRIAHNATRIILLSDSVKRDFESFAPPHAHKARVVRPASYIPEAAYERSPRPVADAYCLPEKFIYVPNQFWKHKNHEAVFRAVRLLKERGLEVIIACSGNLVDYRHPEYFSHLLHLVSSLGIRSQVAMLGLIPREHVFALMRQCLCVLNPSRFEGFGLTSDEARSLGKRTLLSDIAAHREQNPPGAVFFDPRDQEDLAKKMAEVWRESLPGPDPEMELEARASLAERMKAFGEAFLSVLKEVL
jgi:glycosyltransferase involved in cell wall biosynthesis